MYVRKMWWSIKYTSTGEYLNKLDSTDADKYTNYITTGMASIDKADHHVL